MPLAIRGQGLPNDNGAQQNLRAALPAVPWLLGCSALRAKDALRPPARGPALAGSGRHFGQILAAKYAFAELKN